MLEEKWCRHSPVQGANSALQKQPLHLCVVAAELKGHFFMNAKGLVHLAPAATFAVKKGGF